MKKSSVSTDPKGSIKTLDVKKMLSYDNILSGWAIIFIIVAVRTGIEPVFPP